MRIVVNLIISMFIAMFILVAICAIIFFGVLLPPKPSKSNMERNLVKNKEIIMGIATFLREYDSDYISILNTDEVGKMTVLDDTKTGREKYPKVAINDKNISAYLEELFKKCKYQVVMKEKNYVLFQKWSNLDYGAGILFSLDGREFADDNFSVMESLSIKWWYYYVGK